MDVLKKDLFCWFDWDDNTTSVNNINIIKEPRKPFQEYQKGVEITARLPKYGMWKGVIVEIGGKFKITDKKFGMGVGV